MAGSSNFLQFNPNKNNQSTDASYSGSTYRSGGIPAAPSAAPSDVHNKLFYQTTTMAAALAQVMANRGLTVSDADLNSLIAVLDKIITLDSNGDMKTGSSGGNADTATKLKTARKINSVPFDGTSDITVADPTKLPADGNAVSATKLKTAREINGVLFDGTANITIVTETTGKIAHFAMSSPPPGWLKANGAAVSRTTYANLFAAIGTTYGSGNGSTTFNLPDLRGVFVRGWDDGRGVDGGRGFGSTQDFAIQNITGQFGIDDRALNTSITGPFYDAGGADTGSGYGGGGNIIGFDASRVVKTANETRPINVALLACIKY